MHAYQAHKYKARGGNSEVMLLSSVHTKSAISNYTIQAKRKNRRQFSAEEKISILKQAESCTKHGELSALLQEHGIYYSMLATWRRQRDQGLFQALSPRKRGPQIETKMPLRSLIQQVAELEEAQQHLNQRIKQLENIIEKLGVENQK